MYSEQGQEQISAIDQSSPDTGGEQTGSPQLAEQPALKAIAPEEKPVASDAAESSNVTVSELCTDPNYYDDPKGFRQELKRAQTVWLDLSNAAQDLIGDVRVGRSPSLAVVQAPLLKMVESVLRHPDALVWVARLHSGEPYSFSHAVRCAIFAVVFGRRLGLKQPRLETLAEGALLCQIGKTKLPKQLLEKRDPLASIELTRIRGHVELGVDLLRQCGDISEEVTGIVENHCERFDGSGYPHGKMGDEIPLLARVAGLVDCYDAMTSVRPHTDDILSTCDDIEFLYEQRDILFQGQLVEEFIQAFGIYPTGTLVQLNSGDVALIKSQNESNRLQPEILLVLDENKDPLEKFSQIDLRQFNETNADRPLSIKRALSVGEYGLDPNELMRQHAGQKRSWAKLPFGL